MGGNSDPRLMWRGRRLRPTPGLRTTAWFKDRLWKREAKWIKGWKNHLHFTFKVCPTGWGVLFHSRFSLDNSIVS